MKRTVLKLFCIVALAIVGVSCGSIKSMQKDSAKVRYQPSPNPLEAKGEKVAVTINEAIPPKYFKKNAVVFIQPVMQYEGGSINLKPIILKGEKVEGEGTTISYKEGGKISYQDVVDYKPGMETAKITLNPVAYKAKKVNENDKTRQDALNNKDAISLGNVKVTEGINITAERVSVKGNVGVAPHNYMKTQPQAEISEVYFPVNVATLNWNFKTNKEKNTKESVDKLANYVAVNSVPKQITINGWASPEGEENFNVGLSKKRSETTLNVVNDILDRGLTERAKKEGITKPNDLKKYIEEAKKNIVISTNALGEDWENFVLYVERSNIAEKNAIVNVVKSQSDHRKREQEIRNMSVVFRQLEDNVLPWLRRGQIAFQYSSPQKSDQEIGKIAALTPEKLSFDELMYAAYLNHNYATKLKLYKFATENYSSEWTAWNNAGAVCLYTGNISEASRYLTVAQRLASDNPYVLNNLGLLAIANKDYELAQDYFNRSVAAGNQEAKANLSLLKLKTGNFEAAAEELSSHPCTYNLALSQLLSGNTGNAIKTLDCCVDQTAEVYYLRAICYARLDDGQGVMENLKQACDAEPSYKQIAAKDIEFKRFWSNSDFINIVQ